MKRVSFLSFVVVLAFCLLGFTGVLSASKYGGVGIGEFSPVKKANDEIVTVYYYAADGSVKPLIAKTGKEGTQHEDDDLPKGMSGPDKAKRIAKAINDARDANRNRYPVTATATGHVVTVTTTGTAKGLKSFNVTNNTRQKRNKQEVSKSYDVTCCHQESLIDLTGAVSGFDPDGMESEVYLGTNEYQVSYFPVPGATLEEVASMMVQELQDYGIDASLVLPTLIKIVVPGGPENPTHYGCSDIDIDMTIETTLVQDVNPDEEEPEPIEPIAGDDVIEQ